MTNKNKIYLLGFMGSGKSTLGKKLAKKMSQPFYDLDVVIEQKENKTIAEIFEGKGEEHFRELEKKTLQELTDNNSSFVLALGGGTPCYFNNMKFINANGTSIYLKYNAGILHSRLINAKTERPLIVNKTKKELIVFIEDLLKEREKYYSKSKIVVEGNNIKDEDILRKLLNR